MIREAVVEERGLESKPITIFIAKVGETEQELNTKLYKVPAYASNGRAVQTINAVGISKISQDTTIVDTNQFSEVFSLPKNELHLQAGPIDILMGINYPTCHQWSCHA